MSKIIQKQTEYDNVLTITESREGIPVFPVLLFFSKWTVAFSLLVSHLS